MQSQQPKTTLVLDVWYIIIAILCDVPAPEKVDDGERNKAPQSFAKEIPYLRDLIGLSSTCSEFRSILAPRIFKRITLHNTAKSALAVQAIGQGKFAACVKELQYICTHTGSWEPKTTIEELYPPELSPVLSNLARFTSLERLDIHFAFEGDEDLWNLLSDELVDDFYSDAGVAEERAGEEPWRELMGSSFRAIASGYDPQRSPNVHVPHSLGIHGLAPITLPIYYEPAWGSFLSGVKSFTMTIPYLENGAGWCVITQPSYSGFAEYLGSWFFNHLRSAESISFDPSETGILGDMRDRYDASIGLQDAASIGLHDANMPNLRRVDLANLALCDELVGFLVRHSQTLESITLRDCNGFEGTMRWKDLFESLIAASLPRLRSLEIIHEDQDDKERLLFLDNNWADQSLVERARRKIESEPGVRPFPYASLSDKYGSRLPHFDTAVQCFLEGEDDRVFKELMVIVERNAAGSAGVDV
ncbi:hypothetical protein ASPCAL12083 [Aspergillus calidoustus]|uniref:F-box domain-containing protein n=1 Tax=Aspergillus calidoustus TaxID=454130 RepID=A0A0U5CF83_ASPCI|nr:hypothetical protein ASPCAL12083 [Aspergillus calidoustus]